MIAQLDITAAFHASLIVAAILWCVIGAASRVYLGDVPKPRWADLLLLVLGGPVVWAFALWQGLLTARHWALTRHGVAGYRCCGGRPSCRHNPQRAIDRLNNQ